MKQLISLKQFLFIGFIISAIIINSGCQKNYTHPSVPDLSSNLTAQDIAPSIAGRIYLDLTKDQVISAGITNNMLQGYLNDGYKLHSLTTDKFTKHVEFKNSNGNIYYKNGWLKKGTKYLIKTEFEPRILMMCGNDFWPEVD